MARVGYVAQLLNNYYPTVAAQPPLANVNQRAAAVQAAIWFFADRYVLNANDPLGQRSRRSWPTCSRSGRSCNPRRPR